MKQIQLVCIMKIMQIVFIKRKYGKCGFLTTFKRGDKYKSRLHGWKARFSYKIVPRVGGR